MVTPSGAVSSTRAAQLPLSPAPIFVAKAPVASAARVNFAPEPRAPPRLDPPLLEPFVAWKWDPTGVSSIDTVLDVLVKIVSFPVLLAVGVIDLFGGKAFDALHNRANASEMRDHFDAFMHNLRGSAGKEVSKTMARMATGGTLFEVMDGLSPEQRSEVLGLVASKLQGPEAAAVLLDAMARARVPTDLFVRAGQRLHAIGELDETMKILRGMRPTDKGLVVIEDAHQQTPRPMLIAHRGVIPGKHVENTIPAFDASLAAGADGIELDLCVTKDGQVVLWHDENPDDPVSLVRQTGLEPGFYAQPTAPVIGSKLRKRVAELTLDEFRRAYGYKTGDKTRISGAQIPTAGDVGAWAQKQPRLKRLILDTKLAADATDAQVQAYADRIKEAFSAPGLAERCTIMTIHKSVVARLKPLLGPRFRYTLDVEIVKMVPDPRAVTGLEDGRAMDNDTVSMGLPRLGVNGMDTFMQILYDRRGRWGPERADRPEFIGWTVNTEKDARDLIGSGITDVMLTDNLPALLKVRESLFPPAPSAPLVDTFER